MKKNPTRKPKVAKPTLVVKASKKKGKSRNNGGEVVSITHTRTKRIAFPDDGDLQEIVGIIRRARMHVARLVCDLEDLQKGDLAAIRARNTDGPSTLADKTESLAAKMTNMGIWDSATPANVAALGKHLVAEAE